MVEKNDTNKNNNNNNNNNDRDPSMISHTGDEPYNAEPPLASLMGSGFVTPVNLHYVRCHGPVPNATWKDWTVEVTGLVETPSTFTMDQLQAGFSYRELHVTLVCTGNRRKEQNMVKKTSGFDWGAAVVSNSLWGGVPLREILDRCGILEDEAVYVCFEGAEDLTGDDAEPTKYVTCLKKEVAMDPSRDIILAYKQNGEVLTPDHGFPVRMIIPGYIGGRMVKWLKRVTVTATEPDNYYYYKDNRLLPSQVVDMKTANDEGWWTRPEYIINNLNINSVITTPGYNDILSINTWITPAYTLQGYAYSGGGKKVTRVEVTLDGGKSWKVCNLDHQEKPSHYGKYWCWCFWSIDVDVLDLLLAEEIAARAWDETQNMQPENLNWNILGMMNNCWCRLKTEVSRLDTGEIQIAFKHPVLPGEESGGWMVPPDGGSNPTPPSDTFTASEVAEHNSKDSAWIIVHDHVYDVTAFIDNHPGGITTILSNAGKECTQVFDSIHSSGAKTLLELYRIGELVPVDASQETLASSPGVLVE